MKRKIVIILIYAGLAGVSFLYGDPVLAWIQEAGREWMPVVLLVTTVLSMVSMLPDPVLSCVLGICYGAGAGGVLTWLASTLASVLMFVVVRHYFQDWGQRMLNKHRLVVQFTRLYERNAFMAILIARLVPVIPSAIVNIYSPLSRVPFRTFFIASAIGKIPGIFTFALLGHQIVHHPSHLLVTAVVYGLFLTLIYWIYRNRIREKGVHA